MLRQPFGKLRTISRSVTTAQVERYEVDEDYLSSKPYSAIPQIATLKILWSVMSPVQKTILDQVIKSHHDTAGSIFKVCIPGQTDRVFINQPELLRTLMSKDGKMPVESGFDPLVYYRNVTGRICSPILQGWLDPTGNLGINSGAKYSRT